MGRFFGAAGAALLCGAVLSVGAQARVATASGDTCTATGNGTNYTLTVTVPSGAPAQSEFAFNAPGASIVNIAMTGTTGQLSTTSLPPGTTGAWVLGGAIAPGQYLTTIQTTGQATGAFTLIPVSSNPAATYDAVTCALGTNPTPPKTVSNVFVPATVARYHQPSKAWSLRVNVAGPGSLRFHVVAGKTLVQGGTVKAAKEGKTVLVLHPTASGRSMLATAGKLAVHLQIVFTPQGGAAKAKTVTLVLKPVM